MLQTNPRLDLAYEYVRNTNRNIFLTGKAGTGKTTFLQRIRQEGVKRMAVVAPTGVAAINAGGMTIHSLFQLPFGPYLPGSSRDAARQRKFTGEKIRLLQSLDLLVIDEVSMVRADVLDGIDEVLRRYRNPFQPFGGLQLLLIGDLHQLPPVVKDEDWALLRPYYDTPYFFSSQALRQSQPIAIELTHIYRQSDNTFIDLLNRVRDNRLDETVLATLNSRYLPDFRPRDEEGYITLTTHNASAQEINAQRLAAINLPTQTFRAEIKDDFPAHAYPTDEVLELKPGAQVMFVKNDMNREKRYFNGKIGRIVRIEKEVIQVLCPDDPELIPVTPATWENIKYTLNEQTKEVTEQVLGSFTQFPLRLAWAITIHKSQGLTFERVLLDAQAAFAHGQVYVALSRCKSFEGIVLRSRIVPASVKTDSTVKEYSQAAEKNTPDERHLEQSKAAYQQTLLHELFGFSTLKKHLEKLERVFLEHENALMPDGYRQFRELADRIGSDIFPTADKFRPQLQYYIEQGGLPEQNADLQARLAKACPWFAEKIGGDLLPAVQKIPIVTDNKAVLQAAQDALLNLQKELFVKNACFAAVQTGGFSAQRYLRAKVDAELDFPKLRQGPANAPKPGSDVPRDLEHPELFVRLRKWRADYAETLDILPADVLLTKTLADIARRLPVQLSALQQVKGIGKGKSARFGAELVNLVRDYCTAHGLLTEELALPPEPPKPDTKTLSLELLKAGNDIEEIAVLRGLAVSTIEGHLAHFIQTGELEIQHLMPMEEVDELGEFMAEHPGMRHAEVRAFFEDRFSYGQIKMVEAYLRFYDVIE